MGLIIRQDRLYKKMKFCCNHKARGKFIIVFITAVKKIKSYFIIFSFFVSALLAIPFFLLSISLYQFFILFLKNFKELYFFKLYILKMTLGHFLFALLSFSLVPGVPCLRQFVIVPFRLFVKPLFSSPAPKVKMLTIN